MKRGRPPRDLSSGRLTCVTCHEFKPLKDFNHNWDGRIASSCRVCERDYDRVRKQDARRNA